MDFDNKGVKKMARRNKRKKNGNLLTVLIELMVSAAIFIFHIIFYIIPSIIYFIWRIWGYKKSDYYKITHKSLFSMLFDKGARGEYLIYRHLSKLKGNKKWLFNTYLPRENSRTTEVDVILLHDSGVYVFESKNYSGWIFGTEDRKLWTQCLKPSENARTRKYQFLSPIIQNKLHLKYLHRQLPQLRKQNIPVYSIILFGSRCKLKKIKLTSNEHIVISRKALRKTVNKLSSDSNMISQTDISVIYENLYPLTQVSEDVKNKHIADINKEVKSTSIDEEITQDDLVSVYN